MVPMKIRSLLLGALVALAMGGCARSATGPEAPMAAEAAPSFDDSVPPDSVAARGGGALGNGH